MSAKAKKPSIKRIRLLLNVIVIVLLTLLGRHFYDQWNDRKAGEEIIYRCELPKIPETLVVINAQLDDPHVYLSVTAEAENSEIFDQWMGEVDQWKEKQPFGVLNASFRESEQSLRLDFTAELRVGPKENHELP